MPSPVVVDTHAVAWHLARRARLGDAARRRLDAADEGRLTAYVPAIVLAELALMNERGRIRLGVAQVVSALAERPGWQVLALDVEQSLTFATLPGIKDPMDRLVAAASLSLDAPLVSCDETYDEIGLRRIWD